METSFAQDKIVPNFYWHWENMPVLNIEVLQGTILEGISKMYQSWFQTSSLITSGYSCQCSRFSGREILKKFSLRKLSSLQ